MTEVIELSDRSSALGVLKQAFAGFPLLPPGTPIEKIESLLELVMDTFGQSPGAQLHGIRQDGELACVAFTAPNHAEPKGLVLLTFSWRMLRVLGWRLAWGFGRAMAQQPKRDKPYLELVLLGTRPAHHGQGLGRTMLRFLYDHARERGCHGLVLSAAKDTPSYHLYVKEGFVTDRELALDDAPLCHMRRDHGVTEDDEVSA